MKEKDKGHKEYREGIKAGMPIVIGYVPIAVAFGILAKTTGISLLESILFSAIVFAGASQFMALNLLALGVGFSQIILTTFLVNLRHILMSASVAARMKDESLWGRCLVAFGITDETFSVGSFKEGSLSKEYMSALEIVVYLAWVSGTGLGYIVGSILPELLKSCMGVALYAMFAAILTPEMKKSYKVAVLAGSSGLTNTYLSLYMKVPGGWSIVISIIAISLLGVYLFDEKEVQTNE